MRSWSVPFCRVALASVARGPSPAIGDHPKFVPQAFPGRVCRLRLPGRSSRRSIAMAQWHRNAASRRGPSPSSSRTSRARRGCSSSSAASATARSSRSTTSCSAGRSRRTSGVEIDRQGDAFFFAFRAPATAVAGGRRGAAGARRRTVAGGRRASACGSASIPARRPSAATATSASPCTRRPVSATSATAARSSSHGRRAALVEHDLPAGVHLRDLGETRLPGLDRPEPVFQVVAEGLQDRFPPLGARREPAPPLPKGRRCSSARPSSPRSTPTSTPPASGAGRLVASRAAPASARPASLAEARASRGGARARRCSPPAAASSSTSSPTASCASSSSRSRGRGVGERAELLSGPAALAAPLFETARRRDEATTATSVRGAARPLLARGEPGAARGRCCSRSTTCTGPTGRRSAGSSHLQRRLDGLPLLVVAATRPARARAAIGAPLTEILGDPAARVVRPGALGWSSAARSRASSSAREPTDASSPRAVGHRRQPALPAGAARHAPEPRTSSRRRRRGGRAESGRAPWRAPSRSASRACRPRRASLARAVAVLGGRAEVRHAPRSRGLDLGRRRTPRRRSRAPTSSLRGRRWIRAPGRARRRLRGHVGPRAHRRAPARGEDPRRGRRRAGAGRRAPRADDAGRRPVRRRDAAQGGGARAAAGLERCRVSRPEPRARRAAVRRRAVPDGPRARARPAAARQPRCDRAASRPST